MSFENVPNFLGNFFEVEMTAEKHRYFRFRDFTLDTEECQLSRDGTVLPLTPKAFDTLEFLVRNAGRLVSKDDLMQAVWPDSFVDEGNLPRTIYTLRKVLDEDENGNKFIKTVPTKGYRFVAVVERFPEMPAGEGSGVNKTADVDNQAGASAKNASQKSGPRVLLFTTIAVIFVVFLTGLLISNRGSDGTISRIAGQSENGTAYQYFRQGRLLIDRHLEGDGQAALENFDKAIELDPNYSNAYAGRADAKMAIFGVTSGSHNDISVARNAINKALELDETSAYAHTIACRLKGTYDWDYAAAERECRRAIELDPNDHESRVELGFLLNSLGRTDEALSEMDAAVKLSPTSFDKRSRGVVLYFSRRYDEAIEQLKQVDETDPEYAGAAQYLMRAFEMKGDWANALEYYIRYRHRKSEPGEIDRIRNVFLQGGWPAVLENMTDGPEKNPFQFAGTLAQLGRIDEALKVLNDTADRRRVMITQVAREPRFDPLRTDRRYHELLARMGL